MTKPRNPKNCITQKELKELLHYDPDAGAFTWKMRVSNRVKIGDIAGCKNAKGYISICIKGKIYRAHRLAWLYVYGYWPKNEIDHIDQNKINNALINLRDVTRQENQKNKLILRKNKSGVTGIYLNKITKKWQVHIAIDGKGVYLGVFTDKFEAICKRKSAERKYGYHENHGRQMSAHKI